MKKKLLAIVLGSLIIISCKKSGSSANDTGWKQLGDTYMNGNINAIGTDASGNVYAAGDFTNTNGKRFVIKWNGTTWSQLGTFEVSTGINNLIVDHNNNVYVAIGASSTNSDIYLMKWDGGSWMKLTVDTSGPQLVGDMNHFLLAADAIDNIYTVGFRNSNYGIAKWNGSQWTFIQADTFLDKDVTALTIDKAGNIYAAVSDVNGHVYISKWDGVNWSKLKAPNNYSRILSLAPDNNGYLYAGGSFKNTLGFRYVAKYDGTNWVELSGPGALDANGDIACIATDAGTGVYAAGHLGDSSAFYVGKWDGTTWSKLNNGTMLNTPVSSIAVDTKGNVYANGYFDTKTNRTCVSVYLTK